MKILTIAFVTLLEVLRRKEPYVLLVLLGATLMAVVSLDIFGLGGVVRYVKDIALLAAWIFSWILTVNISARQLPDEEAKGTVYSVLSKPVKRSHFLIGKWLGTWVVASIATLSFYLLTIILTYLKGGSINLYTLSQGCIMHCLALSIIAATGLLFSTRMNSDAAASITYTLTATSFLIVPRIPVFLVQQEGFRASVLLFIYNAFPHFEVFDMRRRIVHGYDPVSTGVFGQAFMYCIFATGTLLLLSWLFYHSRKFDRGRIH